MGRWKIGWWSRHADAFNEDRAREERTRTQRRRQEGAKRTTESSTPDSQHPVRLIGRARWTATLPGSRAADGEGEGWKLLPRKGARDGVYEGGE